MARSPRREIPPLGDPSENYLLFRNAMAAVVTEDNDWGLMIRMVNYIA